MQHHETIDPKRITVGMRDQIESLSSTADMIAVLAEQTEFMVHEFEKSYEKAYGTSVGDFRIIATFVRLIEQQAEIVANVISRFEAHVAA